MYSGVCAPDPAAAARADPMRSRARALVVATGLSDRERDVLGLMATGASNAGISDVLWISPKTVESHVRSIYSKMWLHSDLGVERRVSAVLAYLDAQV